MYGSFRFRDLVDPQTNQFGSGLKLAIIRLLANLLENIPVAREPFFSEGNDLIEAIVSCLEWPKAHAEALVHHTTGLSALACIASGMNTAGVSTLQTHFPDWLKKVSASSEYVSNICCR